MLMRVEVNRGEFGTVLSSEIPSVDLNSELSCTTTINEYGWRLVLRGGYLSYERFASKYGPPITNQKLYLGVDDGTIYLKTKRKQASVEFVPGDLSLGLWRRFGIDEVNFADPNHLYPRLFMANGLQCRVRFVFCDGAKDGIVGYQRPKTLLGENQSTEIIGDTDIAVTDSSWSLVNALCGIGTSKPHCRLILRALPPDNLNSRTDQYRWLEQQLTIFLKHYRLPSFFSPATSNLN